MTSILLPSAHDLVHLFAPWQAIYSKSKVVSTCVTGAHLTALLFGGGLAIAADRSTIRAYRSGADDRRRQLAELHQVHRPVLMAIAGLFLSGILLATADLETFLGSPVFWIKLSFVTLLLANGAVLASTEGALRKREGSPAVTSSLWWRLQLTSRLSVALWVSTLIAGVVLVNAA